jgi:CheY-like chemotaxis protein
MSNVLLVDDSASALQAVEMLLTEAGHRVTAFTDGKGAIRALRHETFDLIVTDIYMPEEDGLQVIQAGRRICPNVPIVAMSGVTGNRDMLKVAKRLGACETLRKPFSKAALLNAVGKALGTLPPGHIAVSRDYDAM